MYPAHVTTEAERRMHDDFRLFLFALWAFLGLPPPTPVQYDIAWYLQHGPKRRIVMAFRGVGKSWITAAFVLWLLWRDPQEKIMVVSASEQKALEFCYFTKQIIATWDVLEILRAKAGQRDSTLAFDVGPALPAQAPSVRAVGVGGQMTGGRATRIVFDDIEIPNNSDTEGKREKLDFRARELGGAILVPGGHSIGLGTPQSQQSVYSGFSERGYDIRIWPARKPRDASVYKGRLAPMIEAMDIAPWAPTDPQRFHEEDLMEREGEYGRSGFQLQFMLDTTLADADRYPLKLRDLIVMSVHPERAPVQVTYGSGPQQVIKDDSMPNVGMNGDRFHRPMHYSEEFLKYDGTVMFIDPAGRGRDETAYAVVKMLKGMLYLRRWGGMQDGFSETTLETLAQIAKEEKVNEICHEANFGDGMWAALFSPVLHRIYPCTLTEYKVTGQKEKRICDKLEPVLNSHRLVIDEEAVRAQMQPAALHGSGPAQAYNGLYQLAHITRDRGALRQDDRVDVLAEAVGYFTEQLKLDVAKAEDREREKRLMEALQAHQKSCRALGHRGNRRSFVNHR